MLTLKEIKEPINDYLDTFDEKFKTSMQSSAPLLSKIIQYIIKSKGKKIRPMFVILSAGISGKIEESTYTAASLIELLHTATLIHDDVVDDSYQRRGFFSINALWKNKIAVLVGDYLLSKGLLLSLEKNETGILRIVSEAVKEMSEGELLQIEKARKLDIKEDIFFEIIRKKTASLFTACFAAGASSAGADESTVLKMKKMGEKIGIAFQLKDDLFDFESHNLSGKPNGIDIKEQKMTLPLIYLLNNCNFIDKKKYIHIVKNYNHNPEKVNELIAKVNTSGGIEYTQKKMIGYRDEAIQMLHDFQKNKFTDALEQLIIYTTERKH